MRRPGWSGSRREGALLLAQLVLAALFARPALPAGDGRARGGGQALALDGFSGYLFAPVTLSDPFTKEATVAAWVNLDELPSAAGHIFHIVGKSGFGRDLDLHVETDNRFHFFVARGAPNTLRSTTVVEAGRWYRVAATYRADDVIALYVNGKLEAQRGIPGIARLPNVGPLSVGENFAFPGRKLDGRIDEVSFWSRALSEAEVAALWRAPARKEPGLEAAYRLDGNARDSSSHGLHGQLVGGARYVGPGAPRAEARPVAATSPVDAERPTTNPDAGAPAPLPPGAETPLPEITACPRTAVSLDAKTAFGFSPREALATLHAAEEKLSLSEDHLGFFEGMGLRGPLDGRDQATFRFRPSGDEPAAQIEACGPSGTPSLHIPGSLTAALSRGATYSASAVLEVVVRGGRVEKGFVEGWGTAQDRSRVQLVWELRPGAVDSRAILHHGEADAFWRPSDAPSTAGTADSETENVREAFTAMGGRPLRCSSRPADHGKAAGVPDGGAAPPGRYEGTLPPVSIVSLALPSANHGQGTILMRVAWPRDAQATTFALSLGRAAKTKTVHGYRMVGWSAESAPLPSMLAPVFGCGPEEAARWWIVSQVYPDEQGKLTGTGGFSWGPACGQLISCGF
jgi:hypothetical protein